MHTATVQLVSTSPYSQGKHYTVPKLSDKESAADYEKRTWRERMHYDEKGRVFIPPMALKNCLSDAALFLAIKVPGKGSATYTKHFQAGILCLDPMPITSHGVPILKEEVCPNWLFVPSDAKPGGGKRVEKCFPIIHQWEGTATFYVGDDTVTEDVFRYHLEQAGKFIGLGVFRPRKNGYFGRFDVKEIKWK